MHTPWGDSDSITKLARGWGYVGTPSHGGFYASERFAWAHLSMAAIKHAEYRYGYYWWEEDCSWAIPVWEMPQYWPDALPSIPAAGRENYLYQLLHRWEGHYLSERGQ